MPSSSSSVLKNVPLDLRPEHLKLVQEILNTYVPDCTVWAFGSRTQRNAKPTSDLDLAILDLHPSKAKIIGKLLEAFEESTLPMKVDVLDWNQTNESFRNIIERQKISLQETTI